MANKPTNEKPYEINSIDDFKDERSKELVKNYDLEIEEILFDFIDFQNELSKIDEEFKFNLKDPNLPLNIFDTYKKKYANSLVVMYELLHSKTIKLYVTSKPVIVDSENGKEIKKYTETASIKNILSLEKTEEIIKNYNKKINFFSKIKQKFINMQIEEENIYTKHKA